MLPCDRGLHGSLPLGGQEWILQAEGLAETRGLPGDEKGPRISPGALVARRSTRGPEGDGTADQYSTA
jgi:hypothetical protein